MPRCLVCQQSYDGGRESTCSDECHEELVRRLIAEFGEFKEVVRASTGIAYKVPTLDIIEKGVREQELDQYPLWEEKKEDRREVKPAKLPRFPRFAICPHCGHGGEGDTTVCSYVDAGMPEDSPRFIGCGYCGYDGPAPEHPLYPRDGKHN